MRHNYQNYVYLREGPRHWSLSLFLGSLHLRAIMLRDFTVLILLFTIIGCTPPSYSIRYIPTSITINGKADEEVWSECKSYTSFINPWDPAAIQHTVFQSFYNDQFIFFHFTVTDQKVVCMEHEENNTAVEYSDRVELFFADEISVGLENEAIYRYYGFEFDACGRLQQFASEGYRNFIEGWSLPELTSQDYVVENHDWGYEVELRLPLKELEELGVIQSDSIIMGVFRADAELPTKEGKIQWLSWKEIKTKQPDFHTLAGFKKVPLKGNPSKGL